MAASATIDFPTLARQLRGARPRLADIYLVAGEESALVERAVALLKHCAEGQGYGAESLQKLDGAETSSAEIDMALRSDSLFTGRRLVLVSDVQLLKPGELEKLADSLAVAGAGVLLLLQARGVGPDSRDPRRAKQARSLAKLVKRVQQAGGVVVSCPRLKPREVPRWIEQALAERDLQASGPVVQAIADAVGEDAGAIERAAEKLYLRLGGPGRVTEQHVYEVVSATRTQNIFDLTDAVGQRRPGRALRVLQGALRDGEHPLALLGHLARHFRNLVQVSAAQRRGDGPEQLRRATGLHPFVIKKCQQQARRFTPRQLGRSLCELAAADMELKSSFRRPQLVLEQLVLKLAAPREERG